MKNPVLDMFFKYDKLTNISKCSVQNCTASLKGKHGSNLEKHIFAYHKTQYVELQNAKSNTSDTSISNSATAEKVSTYLYYTYLYGYMHYLHCLMFKVKTIKYKS